MAWQTRPLRKTLPAEPEAVAIAPRRSALVALLFQGRSASARGEYRIFDAAGYRFYRSNSAPPVPADSPFATNATLPYTSAATFADGTWWVSVSYFNGVLDSGFLPVGAHGETYFKMVVASGVTTPTVPSSPQSSRLTNIGGGVLQIAGFYVPGADGSNAATQWAIAYTTDGSTPPTGTPTITQAMGTGVIQILSRSLPAQANGTVVKVQLQTRRLVVATWVYSPAVLLTATADAAGPSAPLVLQSIPGFES